MGNEPGKHTPQKVPPNIRAPNYDEAEEFENGGGTQTTQTKAEVAAKEEKPKLTEEEVNRIQVRKYGIVLVAGSDSKKDGRDPIAIAKEIEQSMRDHGAYDIVAMGERQLDDPEQGPAALTLAMFSEAAAKLKAMGPSDPNGLAVYVIGDGYGQKLVLGSGEEMDVTEWLQTFKAIALHKTDCPCEIMLDIAHIEGKDACRLPLVPENSNIFLQSSNGGDDSRSKTFSEACRHIYEGDFWKKLISSNAGTKKRLAGGNYIDQLCATYPCKAGYFEIPGHLPPSDITALKSAKKRAIGDVAQKLRMKHKVSKADVKNLMRQMDSWGSCGLPRGKMEVWVKGDEVLGAFHNKGVTRGFVYYGLSDKYENLVNKPWDDVKDQIAF